MVQCLACEDWFHESCLNLRERIPPRDEETSADSPASSLPPSNPSEPGDTLKVETTVEDAQGEEPAGRYWDYEDEDDEDDPSIPKALIPSADYDVFICGECVTTSPMLLKWAGSKNARMVVRSNASEDWFVYPRSPEAQKEEETSSTTDTKVGEKRTLEQMTGSSEGHADEPPAKKPRRDSTACNAPVPEAPIRELFERIKSKKGPYLEGEGLHSAGDIFLTAGWRDRWCRCKEVRAVQPCWNESNLQSSVPSTWPRVRIWKMKKRPMSRLKTQTPVSATYVKSTQSGAHATPIVRQASHSKSWE